MPTQAKAALMLSLLAATINFAFFIIVWAYRWSKRCCGDAAVCKIARCPSWLPFVTVAERSGAATKSRARNDEWRVS